MSEEIENKNLIRRYLLGELSEQEREQVEQRLLSDDDFYQQLLIAEDEVVDEFVSDALTESERAKFSQRFLQVPELRQDVRFAAGLRKHTLEAAPQTAVLAPSPTRVSLFSWLRRFFMRPVLAFSLATALLAAVVLVALLSVQNSRLRKQVEQLQAQQTPTPASEQDLQEQLAAERLRNEQLRAELLREQQRTDKTPEIQNVNGRPQPTPEPTLSPPSKSAAVFAVTLTPGLVRDSGTSKKFSLPPATREVMLGLELPASGHSSYSVVLKTVEGRELLSRRGLRTGGLEQSVSFVVPARLLKPNDYQILLTGVTPTGESEEISSYYFRVLK